jgi:hypothetical protein
VWSKRPLPQRAFTFACPSDLIKQLRQQAERQGTTLNAYLLLLIAQSSSFALEARKGGVGERAGQAM